VSLPSPPCRVVSGKKTPHMFSRMFGKKVLFRVLIANEVYVPPPFFFPPTKCCFFLFGDTTAAEAEMDKTFLSHMVGGFGNAPSLFFFFFFINGPGARGFAESSPSLHKRDGFPFPSLSAGRASPHKRREQRCYSSPYTSILPPFPIYEWD